MPLRALRLLHLPTTAEAPTVASALSFSSTLQLAAGRAWARRVLTRHDRDVHGAKRALHTTVPRRHEPPASRRPPTQPAATAGPSSLKPMTGPAVTGSSLPSTKPSLAESQTAGNSPGTGGDGQPRSSRVRKRPSKDRRPKNLPKREQSATTNDQAKNEPITPSAQSPPVETRASGDNIQIVGEEQAQVTARVRKRPSKGKLPKNRPKHEQSMATNNQAENGPMPPSAQSSPPESQASGHSTQTIEEERAQTMPVHQRPYLRKEQPPREQPAKTNSRQAKNGPIPPLAQSSSAKSQAVGANARIVGVVQPQTVRMARHPDVPDKLLPHEQSARSNSRQTKNGPISPLAQSSSAERTAVGDLTRDVHVQRSRISQRPSQDMLFNQRPLPEQSKPSKPHNATRTPPPLPVPNSSESLHRNLLYIFTHKKPVPSLSALIEYHDRYPACHSTASYNFLLTLAIRHHSYGIVQTLLLALEKSGIRKDTETYLLVIRSLIRQRNWQAGWDYAQQLKESRVFPRNAKNEVEIPFSIWVELCTGHPTRHAFPRKVYDFSGQVSHYVSELLQDGTPEELRNRQRLINSEKPLEVPPLAYTPPYGILCLVQFLIRSDDYAGALRLTEAYLKALAHRRRTPTDSQNEACMRIVCALMASIEQKAELRNLKPAEKFNAGQRLLFRLLELHPGLRPTPRTVLVMLSPLKRAMNSATIVYNEIRAAVKRWGPQVADEAVYRRCADLAQKKNKHQILNWAIEAQKHLVQQAQGRPRLPGPDRDPPRRAADAATRAAGSVTDLPKEEEREKRPPTDQKVFEAISTGVPSTKLPLARIYERRGLEHRLWRRVMDRIRVGHRKAAMRRKTTLMTANTSGNSSVPLSAGGARTRGSPDTNAPTPVRSHANHLRSRMSPLSTRSGSPELAESRK